MSNEPDTPPPVQPGDPPPADDPAEVARERAAQAALDRRWDCAVHEAAHAVAGRLLYQVGGAAALFDDDGRIWGEAASDRYDDFRHTAWTLALHSAAGPASRCLLIDWPDPPAGPVAPLAARHSDVLPGRHDEEVVALTAKAESVLDHGIGALWSVAVKTAARELVQRHALEIVHLAQIVYRCGAARINADGTLASEPPPALPAQAPAETGKGD